MTECLSTELDKRNKSNIINTPEANKYRKAKAMKYRIEYTGILGDKWLSAVIYTDREFARAGVKYIKTVGNNFCTQQRARISNARVVPA